MTWESGVMLYLLAMLGLYPVSSARFRVVDFAIVLGGAGLLVTGFLRLI